MDQKAENHWETLSVEDRTKILKEYNFWDGFKTYQFDYLPQDLQTLISLKID